MRPNLHRPSLVCAALWIVGGWWCAPAWAQSSSSEATAIEVSPERRPPSGVLLREGSFLVGAEGTMRRDPQTKWWHFVPTEESAVATHDFTLLPCFVLGEMERMVESMPGEEVVFELTGEVFVYGTFNFVLPTFAPRLVGFRPAPEPAPDVTAPASSDPDAPVRPEDIERRLEQAVGEIARRAESSEREDRERQHADQGELRSEQTILFNRRGTISRHATGAWVFTFDADASGLADPPMVVLPCLLLERIEQYARSQGGVAAVVVSGRVTVFNDRNYMMPTVFRAARGKTPLAPLGVGPTAAASER